MRKAYLQMHSAIFLWGFTGILGRLITLQESVLVWYRMLFSAIALAVYGWYAGSLKILSFKETLKISVVGLLIVIHWVTFYGAIKASNVSITLSCLSSQALFTAFMEPLLNRRKLDPVEIFFGLLAMLGIYLIFHFESNYSTGIILALISAFFGSVFSVVNKFIIDRHDPVTLTVYELGTGWVVLTLLLPILFIYYPDLNFSLNISNTGYLLILALFCTSLAFTISMMALKKISAFTLNLSVNLEPVYGITLAFLIFHENKFLGNGFYYGTAVLLLTVIIHTFYHYRKRKQLTINN